MRPDSNPKKVLVVYTLPPVNSLPGRTLEEFDLREAARAVAAVLPGAFVSGIRGEPNEYADLIQVHRPDVVFNLCEAPLGRPELEAQAAAEWESLGFRFTGARSATLELCRVKDRVNTLLADHGIPVPGSGGFPCVVKPAEEDGSAGICRQSLCHNASELRRALEHLPGRALVEAFIPGREFVVSAWGKEQAEFFSVGETVFAGGLELVTYEAKWAPESSDYRDSPVSYATEIEARLRSRLAATTARVWTLVGARGYLRVDLRLDAAGLPHVLDVNPNPALGESGGIRAAAAEAGWTWARFVQSQVEWAC